ncbi:hypothetical protein Y032_0004g1969 [Ancylostoma ceylanicum]|uniref:Uncharacterized protein n=1 Tax=Ancylostoma ceylanicum TaxID=53326 RepID=A0A016VWK5_9BILA|nr:hypothetical protein Y032_0004g1969 [Ancylostoma ceylanicum]
MTNATTVATTTATIAANVSKIVNTTLAAITTTVLPPHANVTTTNSTALVNTTSTAATTAHVLPSASTAATNTTTTTTTTAMPATKSSLITSAAPMLTSTIPIPAAGGSSGLVFLSVILFVVAVALIAKIIYSNRKRRSDLIGGTARWRLAASQQSGAGPQQTAASYAPMGGARQMNGTNGLDTPGPDRLDWERQFFDDTEATGRTQATLIGALWDAVRVQIGGRDGRLKCTNQSRLVTPLFFSR